MRRQAMRRSSSATTLKRNQCMCSVILTTPLTYRTLTLQVDSDYVDQLEQFVPLVCANCEAHPVGLYDPSPKHVRALNMVCMQALRQHLALAHRVSFTSHHLEQMMNVTLDTLALPASDMDMDDGPGGGIEGSKPLDTPYIRSPGMTRTCDPSLNR